MAFSFSGGGHKPDVHYLFIDGGCLRAELTKFGQRYLNGAAPIVDYARLAHGHTKTFYYDGLPLPADQDKPTSEEAVRLASAMAEHDLLRSLPDWHVYSGEVRGKKRRQKKVDILIAVHMLSHAFRGNMERATLLAGDLDFEPLLESMVQNGMMVTLWHPTTKVVPDLLHAADRVKALLPEHIREALSASQKAMVKLPASRVENSNPYSAASATKTWEEPRFGEAKLYLQNEMNIVVFPYKLRDSRVMVIESADLPILKSYVEDSWGVLLP